MLKHTQGDSWLPVIPAQAGIQASQDLRQPRDAVTAQLLTGSASASVIDFFVVIIIVVFIILVVIIVLVVIEFVAAIDGAVHGSPVALR